MRSHLRVQSSREDVSFHVEKTTCFAVSRENIWEKQECVWIKYGFNVAQLIELPFRQRKIGPLMIWNGRIVSLMFWYRGKLRCFRIDPAGVAK